MFALVGKTMAALMAAACLTACVTQREHVLAPETRGIVIDASTGKAVSGAQVRFVEVAAIAPAVTTLDGAFDLPGLTDKRTIIAMPMGGIYRDSSLVLASAPDLSDGYASAAFINGGQPAEAIYRVVVVMFAEDAAETALHRLMKDCLEGPAQEHALHLSAYVAGIDPKNPPGWFDARTAEALDEHLRLMLPSSGFMTCERWDEAYEMFRAQREPLNAIMQAAYIEALPPALRPATPVEADQTEASR